VKQISCHSDSPDSYRERNERRGISTVIPTERRRRDEESYFSQKIHQSCLLLNDNIVMMFDKELLRNACHFDRKRNEQRGISTVIPTERGTNDEESLYIKEKIH